MRFGIFARYVLRIRQYSVATAAHTLDVICYGIWSASTPFRQRAKTIKYSGVVDLPGDLYVCADVDRGSTSTDDVVAFVMPPSLFAFRLSVPHNPDC
jgi:hypothetical protein